MDLPSTLRGDQHSRGRTGILDHETISWRTTWGIFKRTSEGFYLGFFGESVGQTPGEYAFITQYLIKNHIPNKKSQGYFGKKFKGTPQAIFKRNLGEIFEGITARTLVGFSGRYIEETF